MTSSDEHAAEALRLEQFADETCPRGGTDAYAIVTAIGALMHAVLSLRPVPADATFATTMADLGAALRTFPVAPTQEAEQPAPRMHVFGMAAGPTVTLTLPRDVAEDMEDAIFRHVPGYARADGLVDELRAQLADQRPGAEE